MITLEASAAEWARHQLRCDAQALKMRAFAARRNAKHNVLLRQAAEFVAASLERQAAELLKQIDAINPATVVSDCTETSHD